MLISYLHFFCHVSKSSFAPSRSQKKNNRKISNSRRRFFGRTLSRAKLRELKSRETSHSWTVRVQNKVFVVLQNLIIGGKSAIPLGYFCVKLHISSSLQAFPENIPQLRVNIRRKREESVDQKSVRERENKTTAPQQITSKKVVGLSTFNYLFGHAECTKFDCKASTRW